MDLNLSEMTSIGRAVIRMDFESLADFEYTIDLSQGVASVLLKSTISSAFPILTPNLSCCSVCSKYHVQH